MLIENIMEMIAIVHFVCDVLREYTAFQTLDIWWRHPKDYRLDKE